MGRRWHQSDSRGLGGLARDVTGLVPDKYFQGHADHAHSTEKHLLRVVWWPLYWGEQCPPKPVLTRTSEGLKRRAHQVGWA